jgi:hypothetical protein
MKEEEGEESLPVAWFWAKFMWQFQGPFSNSSFTSHNL